MPTPIFTGRTSKGRLQLDERERFERYLIGLDGCEIEIAVRKRRRVRSSPQNGYYWTVVNVIADYTGHTSQEVHEILGQRFLQDHTGRRRSTSALSTAEFSEYVERCLQLAAEYGIIIPPPGRVAR